MAEEARAVAELSAASMMQSQLIAQLQAENKMLREAVEQLYAGVGRGPQRRTLARRGG